MRCTRINVNGMMAIVCASGRSRVHACGGCGAVALLQCDWKISGGKTCDAWICKAHALEVGPDKHLYPAHQVTYKDWLAMRDAPKEPA